MAEIRRIVLTERERERLQLEALHYNLYLRQVWTNLAWRWSDAACAGLRRDIDTAGAISDLFNAETAVDADLEYCRVTIEFSDAPFPDVVEDRES